MGLGRWVFVGLATLALSASACGGLTTMNKDLRSAITLAELTADPDRYTARLTEPGQELVVAIRKGDTLPLDLALDAPQVATLEAGVNRLRFTQDLYLALGAGGAFVSKDGVSWAAIGDAQALKQLFGIEQGAIQAGLGASQEKGPFLSLGLALE